MGFPTPVGSAVSDATSTMILTDQVVCPAFFGLPFLDCVGFPTPVGSALRTTQVVVDLCMQTHGRTSRGSGDCHIGWLMSSFTGCGSKNSSGSSRLACDRVMVVVTGAKSEGRRMGQPGNGCLREGTGSVSVQRQHSAFFTHSCLQPCAKPWFHPATESSRSVL